jgi:hypothetical protein
VLPRGQAVARNWNSWNADGDRNNDWLVIAGTPSILMSTTGPAVAVWSTRIAKSVPVKVNSMYSLAVEVSRG